MAQKSATPPPRHRLLNVKEFRAALAARGLEAGTSTVYHWLENGRIKGHKVFGRWRVHPDQIEVALRQQFAAEMAVLDAEMA